MIYSVQEIKFEFIAFIKERGGDFSDWYIGIAADPLTALKSQHKVDQNEDDWIYKQALTFQALEDTAQVTGIEAQLTRQVTCRDRFLVRDLVDHPALGQGEGAAQQALVQHADPAGVEAGEGTHRFDPAQRSGLGHAPVLPLK